MIDKWLLVHRYNRLVRILEAKPLTCPDCQEVLTTKIGPDDDPAFFCLTDDRDYRPGTKFWADINAVVSEHYV